MRKKSLILVLVSILVGSLALAAPAWARLVNRIVAVVNEDVITQTDLDLRVRDLVQLQYGGQPGSDAQIPNELISLALRQLVDQRLIVQQAQNLGISIGTDEISSRVREAKQKLGTDAAFKAWLDRAGITEAQFRRRIEDQMIAERMVSRKIRSQIHVTPQEVSQELAQLSAPEEQVNRAHVRHLLVRVSGQRNEEAARKRAEDVHQRLLAGESFAELAREFSDDPNAAQGGDLGWVERGQLLPDLDQAIFETEPGSLSNPIRTRLGFHIVRVEEISSRQGRMATDPNEEAHRRIYQRKFEQAMQDWLNQLMQDAYIEVLAAN